MPVLANARRERFAQAIAEGKNALQAHEIAGYKADDGNASKLAGRPDVQARVQEITGAAAEKSGITAERVLTELAKIGFADIRKAVEWHGSLIREKDQPDGGDVLVIKEIFSNHVRLVDSDQIDEDTAAAIAEVRQSPTGGLSIKLHDKRAALVDLGKHLGMFKDHVEHSGKIQAEGLVVVLPANGREVATERGSAAGAAADIPAKPGRHRNPRRRSRRR